MEIVEDHNLITIFHPYGIDSSSPNGPWEFIEFLQKIKNKKIVVFNPEEFDPFFRSGQDGINSQEAYWNYVDQFNSVIAENDITLEYWISIHDDQSLEWPREFKVKAVNWPAYQLHCTAHDLQKDSIQQVEHINKLAISMNSKPAHHRCMLIESIYKEQLQNDFCLSWLMPDAVEDFHFEHFDNQQHVLDYDPGPDPDPRTIYPPNLQTPTEFYTCLFNIVAETTVDLSDIIEKTFVPLLCGKPFLVLGFPGLHRMLVDHYGIKLFEEHVDYGFDDVEDTQTRINLILNQIAKYRGENYNDLYREMLPVIEHNKKLCWDIVHSKSMFPEDLSQRVKHLSQSTHWLADTIIT